MSVRSKPPTYGWSLMYRGDGPIQDQSLEQVRLTLGGKNADHAAHRMADENRVAEIESVTDVEHVLGVSVERRIPLGVVSGEVGIAGANIIEENNPIVVRECGHDEAPHVLVAAKAVCEKHRLGAVADNVHVIPSDDICHCGSPTTGIETSK